MDVIILATAPADFSRPSTVVLAKYHPGLFGGVRLLLIGGFDTVWFWPGRRSGK